MKIEVKKLESFDTYRDGGSISATFYATGSDTLYTLMLKIENSPLFDKNVKECTYKDPILIMYEPTIYVCPMTGQKIPDNKKSQRDISWLEANGILAQIDRHQKDFASKYLWVYGAMVKSVKDHGI